MAAGLRPPHLLPGQSPDSPSHLLFESRLESWHQAVESGRGRLLSVDKLAALTLALSIVFAQVGFGVGTASASATFVVNSTADVVDLVPGDGACDTGNTIGSDPECTLRAAVQEANTLAGTDTITVPAGTYTLTITGNEDSATAGDLDVSDSVIVVGAGAGITFIDGAAADGAFEIRGSATVTISRLTIQNSGGSNFSSGVHVNAGTSATLDSIVISGGTYSPAIYNSGTLDILDSRLTGNVSTFNGGGIFTAGPTTISDTLIDNNSTNANGGGIYVGGAGGVSLTNVTLSGNSASVGGGLYNEYDIDLVNATVTLNSAIQSGGLHDNGGATTTLLNTIVAGNTGGNPDGNGSFDSLGYNIIGVVGGSTGWVGTDRTGVDPQLQALADNGGPTPTHALTAGSEAIDNGTASSAPATDQRGVSRDGSPDIGAYEYEAAISNIVLVNSTADAPDSSAGDNVCATGGTNIEGDPECTLRAAIQEANASAAIDAINFAIPVGDTGYASGVWTIAPSGSALDWIVATIDIDGSTQPGYAGAPVVVIDGTALSSNEIGLGFADTAADSRVAGLSIVSFPDDSISSVADRLIVEDNYLGVLPDGITAPGSGSENIALWGAGSDSVIRDNLIAGAAAANIAVTDTVTGLVITGNKVGTDISGTVSLGGGQAFWTDTDGTVIIGGTGAGDGNTMADSMWDNIQVAGSNSTVTILGNSIHGAGLLGIDLVAPGDSGTNVTANDSGDGDSGPNDLLNFPVITSATESGGTVTVTFDLDVPANPDQYRVEFFTNPSGADASGYGEAETFVSAVTTSPGTGLTHAFAGAAGDVITATATRVDSGAATGFSSTSEISAAYTVTAAPSPASNWSTFLGGALADAGQTVAVDAGGNVYVAGYSSGTWGSPVRAYGSGNDIFVAKLDASGTLVWNTFLGGPGDDQGFGITVDASGNVYVAGQSGATWGSPVRAYGGGVVDAFVAKLNSSGNLVWNTFLGGSGYDYGYGIDFDAAGNVYVSGNSSATWGSPVRSYTGSADIFVVKLNSSGALAWSTFLGGTGSDGSRGVAVDGSGNVYVGGFSSANWGSPVRAYSSGFDLVAVKLNSSGALTWNSFLGGSGYEVGEGLALDGSGNLYMTGYGDTDFGSPVQGNGGGVYDALAVKVNNNGTLVWNTFAGGTGGDYGHGISVAGSSVYIAGSSDAAWGAPSLAYGGGSDGFVAEFSTSDGSRTTLDFLGGAGTDYAYEVATDGSDGVYVAGSSNTTWGTPIRSYTAGTDAFAMRIERSPLGPCADSDSDGLCDLEEDANTDADNNPATNPGPDTDGDTTPNYLDADDDGDGTPTVSENADPNADGDPRDALDSDRDGQPDWLDLPTSATGGTVATERKISDTAGGLTATLDNYDEFGRTIEPVGDLDGDGITDLVVGVWADDDGGYRLRRCLYVLFLNADGAVKAEQKISDTAGGLAAPLGYDDDFGHGVAGIGDLDGDGINDMAVGAFLDDDGGIDRGAVYVLFLNADGTVKAEQKISDTVGGLAATLDNDDHFGIQLAAIGDLDGDGVNDLAVAASNDDDGGIDRGAVYVLFLNADGTVKAEQKISDTAGGLATALGDSDEFGISVGGPGDVDGDGVADLAVGAYYDDDGGTDRGAVYVLFLNADGTVKAEQKISDTTGGLSATLVNGDWFGYWAAGIGDLDGDGTPDLAVGARHDDDGGTDRGAAYVLFLNADGTVRAEQAISDTQGGFVTALDNSDWFGASVAGLGDLDGDGTINLAVGAPGDDDGGTDHGAVYILDLAGWIPPTGPGGVDGDLGLWLRADAGVTTSGVDVTTWLDQSGNGNNAAQGTTSLQPDLVSGVLNGNPVVDFDGVDDGISGTAGASSTTYFIVFIPDAAVSSASTGQTVFSWDCPTCTSNTSILGIGSLTGAFPDEVITHGLGGSTDWRSAQTGTATYAAGDPILVAVRTNATNNGIDIYSSGTEVDSATAGSYRTVTDQAYSVGRDNLASPFTPPMYFNGKIAEVIAYSSRTTDAEQQQIQSYLAIKYGLTLNQAVAYNYVASDGTVIWDATANAVYKNDIAGIGQDDSSVLDQTQSQSISADAMVTVSNASSQDDGDFLVWGNDNGVTTWTATGSPIGQRLQRTWRADATGTIGTVTVAIDLTGLSAPGTITSDYHLLVDADGDFSAGATDIVASSFSGNTATFDLVTIPDGSYFTVAAETSPPTVNSTGDSGDASPGDGVCDTGGTNSEGAAECTLRAAVEEANASAGIDTIEFDIPTSDSGYSAIDTYWTIQSGSALNVTGSVTIDATTQPGYTGSPDILLLGSSAVAGTDGFEIPGDNITIRGFAIASFPAAGVYLPATSDGATIESSYIGTDITGAVAAPNTFEGVWIEGATNVTVGGTGVGNVISGNTTAGVGMDGASGVDIVENLIGTTADGLGALGNGANGIDVQNSSTVLIDGNVIAASIGSGVIVWGSSDTTIINNYIGTDATGLVAVANTADGIHVGSGSTGTVVGQPGAGNVLSGNGDDGIEVVDTTGGTAIQANTIGLGSDGDTIVANGRHGVVLYNGANNTQVGGTTVGARNVISGNTEEGVRVDGNSNALTADNIIEGNLIGTDATGSLDRGNGTYGVYVFAGAVGTTIGGTAAGAGNTISGNGSHGVHVEGAATTGTLIQGNYIGLNSAGDAALGNTGDGVSVAFDVPNQVVGGAAAGAGNVISANLVGIYSLGADNLTIQGNIVGLDATGTVDLGNTGGGIRVGGDNVVIGGTTTNARNIVSGNGQQGIFLDSATGAIVHGNYVGTDISGLFDRGNDSNGVYVSGNDNQIGGSVAGAGNVVSGNTNDGIQTSSSSPGTIIEGNIIGLGSDASTAIPNSYRGVSVYGMTTRVGGTDPGAGNTISANFNRGVSVITGADDAAILGNSIYANGSIGIDLGDNGVTTNDAGDGDTGPNGLLNYPVITSANGGAGSVTVYFDLDVPAGDYRIEFFTNSAADPSGYGEGETYAGSYDVVGHPGGSASYVGTMTANLGDLVTATATEATALPFGATSEFSPVATVVQGTLTVNSTADGVDTNPGDGVCTTGGTNSAAAPECTLRAAIEEANALAGADVIEFGMPNTEPGYLAGVWTIRPTSALPAIGDYTEINGTTQTGYSANTNSVPSGLTTNQVVVINGSSAGAADGLTVTGNSVLIKGLVVNGFGGNGIEVDGDDATVTAVFVGTDAAGASAVPNTGTGIYVTGSAVEIGSTSDVADRFLVSGNGSSGIDLVGTDGHIYAGVIGLNIATTAAVPNGANGIELSGTTGAVIGSPGFGNIIAGNNQTAADGVYITGGSGHTIEANIIGTNGAGAALGNFSSGVAVSDASSVAIGGPGAGEGNVIAANTYGVHITGSLATGNSVVGNYIGVDVTGLVDLGNTADGVVLGNGASGNIIGGPTAAHRNIISGNDNDGVWITDPTTTGNTVQGNWIGYAADASSIGNLLHGVAIEGSAHDNLVGGANGGEGNRIVDAGWDGITVVGGIGNSVLGNEITGSGDMGIDLGDDGWTANDAGDVDAGSNDLLNYPVITSAIESGGMVAVDFDVDLPAGDYRIEFFANTVANPSGYGEGQSFVVAYDIVGHPGGAAAYSTSFAGSAGWLLTATTTEATAAPFGSTSEFSAATSVVADVFVVNSTGDSGDANPGNGACDTGGTNSAGDPECTLRAAIQESDALAGGDQIEFDIPATESGHSGGVWTITPVAAYPNITDQVSIDARTQPGWAGAPIVEISGTATTAQLGLDFQGADSLLAGIAIGDYLRPVVTQSPGMTIVGTWIGVRADGVSLWPVSPEDALRIVNGAGSATIGSADPADRNVFVDASNAGIYVWLSNFATVQGNYIGVLPDGVTPAPNGAGISNGSGSSDLTIGGQGAGEGNVIVANTGAGITLPAIADNALIAGNAIGVDAVGGAAGNGEDGIAITSASTGIRITGNEIANNGGVGVAVSDAGALAAITGNAIHANTGLGIDLGPAGVTANDAGDSDTGANGLLNYPVIDTAIGSAGVVSVDGTWDVPSGWYRIEVFINTAADGSGFGEGASSAGTTTLYHSGGGDEAWSADVPGTVGSVVTATTTSCTDASCTIVTATSEFSAVATVLVPDTTPPVISLLGSNPQTIEVGSSYVELGATATDDRDGDVTALIVTDASAVDTSVVGSYLVTYNVSDSSGNAAIEVTRTVDVVDTTVPVITLVGANPQTIEVGSVVCGVGCDCHRQL